jgi:choline-sulfatase
MDNPPNVLFLLSDEHSFRCFSHLDPAGEGEPVHTPALDALAASATTFAQAYCQMPLCTPSRLCLLTGREARRCGAWTNKSVLAPGIPTLPGTFADAGYTTALVGKMHFGGNRQFGGFQHRPYGDLTGGAGHQADPLRPERRHEDGARGRTANAGVTDIPESLLQEQVVARETIAFLREHRHARPDRPWFLCASFSRPHFPLTAPRRYFERYWPQGTTPPKVGRMGDAADHPLVVGMARHFKTEAVGVEETLRARAAYFACVDYLDEVIGDLLAVLERDGLLEDTIVVYTTDHGEMAGEHGLWWKQSWHEGCTRVPLFIQLPEQRAGRLAASRLTTPVSLADLFPTLCGLADVPLPEGLDGADLSGSVRDGAEPSRGPIYCDKLLPNFGAGTEFRLVREGRYKYVGFRDASELLFDLAADPLEQRNLAADAAGEDVAALTRLRELVARTMDFAAAESERRHDQEEQQGRYELDLPQGIGNAYLLPDGRLVNAELTLYKPEVLAEHPAEVFADWPGEAG